MRTRTGGKYLQNMTFMTHDRVSFRDEGDERREGDIMTKITHDQGTTIKDTFDTFGTRPTKKYNHL